jgi:hypothetical protein
MLGRGWVHWKKGLKIKGTTVIRVKGGIQWNRSQIRVPTELYSDMNNTVVLKGANSKQ